MPVPHVPHPFDAAVLGLTVQVGRVVEISEGLEKRQDALQGSIDGLVQLLSGAEGVIVRLALASEYIRQHDARLGSHDITMKKFDEVISEVQNRLATQVIVVDQVVRNLKDGHEFWTNWRLYVLVAICSTIISVAMNVLSRWAVHIG